MLPRSTWILSRLYGMAQEGATSSGEAMRAVTTSATNLRLLRDPQPPQPPPGTLEGVEKPDLVSRFLSADNAPRSEYTRARLLAAASSQARFPGDVGSTEVQVARLTARVAALAEHLSTHRKDHSSRRGLQAMLMQRRSLLQYLRRTQFDSYVALIRALGLKDAPYAPQDRFSLRYKAAPSGGAGKGAAAGGVRL